MSSVREATHAGSWYTSNRSSLEAELSKNLSKVTPLPELDFSPPVTDAKAIIAPHAGYAYSGGAAAWAYAAVPTDKIKRVFLLGPSHHKYIDGIALSPFSSYDTPLGEIPLCIDTLEELEATGAFRQIRPGVDEDEHSLEMHLPYIRHIFKGRVDLRLVPLIVGSAKSGSKISSILEKYWKDPETFFIISSDFCHWGTRFSCTPYYHNAPHPPIPVPPLPHPTLPASFEPPEFSKEYSKTKHAGGIPIWQSIQYLDHQGIDLLREPAGEGAAEKWEAYLDRTKNTICGRNPITVLLHLIQHVYAGKEGPKPEFTFVRYEQSSKCEKASDSSVSYVSGVLRVPS